MYHPNKHKVDYEPRYIEIKKICSTPSKKFKDYVITSQLYPILQILRLDPLDYLSKKAALTRRLVKWQMILAQHEINFIT